jgi:hypothetical protein
MASKGTSTSGPLIRYLSLPFIIRWSPSTTNEDATVLPFELVALFLGGRPTAFCDVVMTPPTKVVDIAAAAQPALAVNLRAETL